MDPRYAPGSGTALLNTVELWAREAGLAAMTLTLTTFADVPWNAL